MADRFASLARSQWLVLLAMGAVVVLLTVVVSLSGRHERMASETTPAESAASENSLSHPSVVDLSSAEPSTSSRHSAIGPSVIEASHAGNRRVRVRSGAGLLLESIECKFGERPWRSVSLIAEAATDGSTIALPPEEAVVLVRAPGHLAARVTADELELQPDALLEVEMPGLAAKVTALELPLNYGPTARADLEACSTWGFSGMDRFAVAVEVPCFLGKFPDAELQVGLALGPHQRIVAKALLVEGLRAHGLLPSLGSPSQDAPLNLRLRSGDGTRPTGTTELTVWTEQEDEAQPRWLFDWGTLTLETTRVIERLSVRESEVTLDSLVLGMQYRIGAEQPETGAAGCVLFTHAGGAVEIELLPGVRLFGVLEGRKSLPEKLRAEWSWTESDRASADSDGEYEWLDGSDSFRLDPSGAFELVARRRGFPGRPPRSPPPPSLTLHVEVSGFTPLDLAVDLEGRHEVDLGTIVLESRDADLVLSTHPFRGPDDLRWSTFQVSDGSLPGSFEVAWARALEDGGLEVFLQREEGAQAPDNFSFRPAVRGKHGAVAYPRPVPELIVLHGRREGRDGAVPTLFGLTHAEPLPSYAWIAGRLHHVSVEFLGVAPEVDRVWLGWSWGDAVVTTKSVHEELSLARSFEFTFEAPDGASFWWTWSTRGSLAWPPVASHPLLHDTESFSISQ